MKRKEDINGVKFSHFGIPEEFQEPGDEKIRKTEEKHDGYHVGDRMLDGVLFDLKIVDGGLECTMPIDAYTQGLNKDHWEQAVLEDALKYDVFGEQELCLIMENGSCAFEMVQ